MDVVRPDGAAAYAGLTHGTVCYIVGVPDQPFEVRVTAPQHVFRTSPTLQVFLKVEGVSPNICNTLYATFRGFVNTVKGQHVINQFLFGAAQTDSEAPALAPGATKVGGLNVSINEVRELPGVHEPLRHVASQTAGGFKAVEGDLPGSHCNSGCLVAAENGHLQTCLILGSVLPLCPSCCRGMPKLLINMFCPSHTTHMWKINAFQLLL